MVLYKCRIFAKANDFKKEIVLIYRLKGTLSINKAYIYYEWWTEDNAEGIFISRVKELNSMCDKDFIKLVRSIIAEREKHNHKIIESVKEFDKEIRKLNKRGKFNIEI